MEEKKVERRNAAGAAVEAVEKLVKGVGSVIGVTPKAGERTQKLPNRIKILISIVNHDDEKRLKEILDDASVSLSYTFAGTGTARTAVLDYLGIGGTEKSVVLSLIPESDEENIMRELRTRMSLYLVGRGISFTIPLSAVSEIVANGLQSAATEKTIDGSKIMKDEQRQYDLIIAAVAANFVDDAMEAARSAGAAGGTIVRGRSVSNEKAEQFIGISLMHEQELLFILSTRERKLAIMQALSEKVGLKTEAGGVIFSVPVDRTAGIAVAAEAQEAKEGQA